MVEQGILRLHPSIKIANKLSKNFRIAFCRTLGSGIEVAMMGRIMKLSYCGTMGLGHSNCPPIISHLSDHDWLWPEGYSPHSWCRLLAKTSNIDLIFREFWLNVSPYMAAIWRIDIKAYLCFAGSEHSQGWDGFPGGICQKYSKAKELATAAWG